MEESLIQNLRESLDQTLESLRTRFNSVRAGRANPSSLDIVIVNYYGSLVPLKQIAMITTPEANQLLIKPFDKSALAEIEKAILGANLGYTPNNDGETIRIVIPALTKERREELSKNVKALAEDAKVSVRNVRRDILSDLKKLDLSEDLNKLNENEIQKVVDEYNKKIETMYQEKANDLLTI